MPGPNSEHSRTIIESEAKHLEDVGVADVLVAANAHQGSILALDMDAEL